MGDPENTKLIPLTQGKFALVDAEDYEWLMQRKWHFGARGYAVRNQYIRKIEGKRKCIKIYMHVEIMQTPEGFETDHRDHDGLNNRRYNLRTATNMQNQGNQRKKEGCSSVYKGVSWCKARKKWEAKIMINYRSICLGRFHNEIAAALAYDRAAAPYFGEFALVNFPKTGENSPLP